MAMEMAEGEPPYMDLPPLAVHLFPIKSKNMSFYWLLIDRLID
jgi:hypothetical protein